MSGVSITDDAIVDPFLRALFVSKINDTDVDIDEIVDIVIGGTCKSMMTYLDYIGRNGK
jgi:hypothetical protein